MPLSQQDVEHQITEFGLSANSPAFLLDVAPIHSHEVDKSLITSVLTPRWRV
jgi:hypothetical protein